MSGRPHDPGTLPPAPRAGGVLPSRPLPAPARLALDVGLGVAAALGQAPWGLWPVTLIALAALLWRIGGAPSARAAFLRALAGGAGLSAIAGVFLVPGAGALPLLVIMLASAVGSLVSIAAIMRSPREPAGGRRLSAD